MSPYLWRLTSTVLVWLVPTSICNPTLALGWKAAEYQSWGRAQRELNSPPPIMNTGKVRDFLKHSHVRGRTRTENPGLQAPSPDLSAPYNTNSPSGNSGSPWIPQEDLLDLVRGGFSWMRGNMGFHQKPWSRCDISQISNNKIQRITHILLFGLTVASTVWTESVSLGCREFRVVAFVGASSHVGRPRLLLALGT